MSLPTLPPDLEQTALGRFDHLVRKGEIKYREAASEIIHDRGFTFEFRICPILVNKTILAADAPERKAPGGAFTNPEEDFIVTRIADTHVLILSNHAIYRPHYVLHTRLFAPQTDDLNLPDFEVAWAILKTVREPHLMIYNCGVDAGLSQGHKHMQLFPRPSGYPGKLFPEFADPTDRITSNIPHVPHQHYVLRFPGDVDPRGVLDRYYKLLESVRNTHRPYDQGEAYNVIMALDWICLIPRRHAGKDNTGANAAGMLGIIWVRDEQERDSWTALGLSDHLKYLGFPADEREI